jgi:hypothetical protein
MTHTTVILPTSSAKRASLLHQAYAAGHGVLPEHIHIQDGQAMYYWNDGITSTKPCVIVDVQFAVEAQQPVLIERSNE